MKVVFFGARPENLPPPFHQAELISCQALEFRSVSRALKIPKKEFDFLLVTSKNALKFLKKLPRAKEIIFIGKKTADIWKDAYRDSTIRILKDSHSEGVLEFFRPESRVRGSILFPRSSLADVALVRHLRGLGYHVSARHTYSTKILDIRRPLLKIMRDSQPDAFFVSSPSIVTAIKRAMKKNDRDLWKPLKWICIGPTTLRAVLDSFDSSPKVCQILPHD